MILNGILIVNKPKGMTSHDVVDFVRRSFKMRRVGHAGTLDPLATGVLVILLGKCTKLFHRFLGFDKEYTATLRLGARTSTGDIYGKVIEERVNNFFDEVKLRDILNSYLGEILQVPPMVSAIKYKGQRLYRLARQGKEVERSPRRINIRELRLLEFRPPDIKFYMRCSSGTYVRQLAEDIARDCGCIGCVSQIEREGIGPYKINRAISLEEIKEDRILSFKD